MTDLTEKQQALEFEAMEAGINEYKKRIASIRSNSQHSDNILNMRPEAHLLNNAVLAVATRIDEVRPKSRPRGNSPLNKAWEQLSAVPAEELSFLACRKMFSIYTPQPIAKTCRKLGQDVLDHLNYVRFRDAAPGYVKYLEESVKSGHETYKHRVLTHARLRVVLNKGTEAERVGLPSLHWTSEECTAVGNLLIDAFIQVTHLYEITEGGRRKRKYAADAVIAPTQETLDWLSKQHDRCATMYSDKPPMVCPPKPWTDLRGGGYLSTGGALASKLIRTGNKEILGLARENREAMQPVYDAVNTLQETRWRINTKVLEVMDACRETGIGGLPPGDINLVLPPKQWSNDAEMKRFMDVNPDGFTQWKHERHEAYDRWNRGLSQRLALLKQIEVARKYSAYDAIYFCWNMDWRGRMYPIQTWLHPQVDHIGKSLIEFADGKPLTEAGARRLAIFGAGLFGEDKKTYEYRINEWLPANEEAILDSARNPLDGQRFWTKAEKPYMFLAFCFEWAGYKAQGPGFISHLPVQVDGKCNGTQHCSAIMRDEVGGKYVGLIPQENPSDLYSEVAGVSAALVAHDAKHGQVERKETKSKGQVTVKVTDYKRLGAAWDGKVTRKIAKRNTMTLSYGATRWGFTDQLVHELHKLDEDRAKEGLGPYIEDIKVGEAAAYMAKINYKAIGKVIVKSIEQMEWMQIVAKACAKAGIPLQWSTPMGFTVRQARFTQKLIRVSTWFGGVRIMPGAEVDTADLSPISQANACAPNFIHSLDAAHLQATALRCKAAGIDSFSFIHDSYGCHACDIDLMDTILRDTFIDQYSGDALGKWFSEVTKDLPADVLAEIPPRPSQGNLDLEGIRQSQYFFNS